MFKRQENKHTAYQNTINEADQNHLVWSTHVAFSNGITGLKSVNAAISTQASIQRENITGIAVDKTEKKISLVSFILNVAGAVAAYSRSINDNALFKKVDFTESKLNRQRDTLISGTAQKVHEIASGLISHLSDYGITAVVLLSFQDEIDSYTQNFVTAPEQAIINRKNITENVLPQLFEQADAIINDKLLKLVVQFKSTNPDFVNKFIDSTRIGSSGVQHTRLAVTATFQSDSGSAPASNAEVFISNVLLIGFTDTNGKCTISKVPIDNKAGKSNYDVRVTFNGQSQTFPAVEFKRGKSARISAQFEANQQLLTAKTPAVKEAVTKK